MFLESKGQVLLARRSDDVRTYPGHWAGISGYLEGNDPQEQAEREIREETNLDPSDFELIRGGPPLDVDDGPHFWRIYPFRYLVTRPEAIELDWEHTTMEWTDPADWDQRKTVPKLREARESIR